MTDKRKIEARIRIAIEFLTMTLNTTDNDARYINIDLALDSITIARNLAKEESKWPRNLAKEESKWPKKRS